MQSPITDDLNEARIIRTPKAGLARAKLSTSSVESRLYTRHSSISLRVLRRRAKATVDMLIVRGGGRPHRRRTRGLQTRNSAKQLGCLLDWNGSRRSGCVQRTRHSDSPFYLPRPPPYLMRKAEPFRQPACRRDPSGWMDTKATSTINLGRNKPGALT